MAIATYYCIVLEILLQYTVYLLQWSWEILQPNTTVAIISSNSNTVLYGCKSTRQLQRQSILMQRNVIMAIFWTYSSTFLKRVAISLTSCNGERKYCNNALFLWQHSPPYCHLFGQMLQNTSLLQHNLWWCKWLQVAIESKSSPTLPSHCGGWTAHLMRSWGTTPAWRGCR
jgi:hypothetical protein